MNHNTKEVELKVIELRKKGLGYKTIADEIGVTKDRVKYYSKKNQLSGFIAPSLSDEAYERFINGFNSRHGEHFTYVSGFKNSEAPVLIECQECGNKFTRSAQVARKSKNLTCGNCILINAEQRETEKELEKEIKRLNREKEKNELLLLHKQEREHDSIKQCGECGETFKANHLGAKYCSDKCSNRHGNRARELNKRNKVMANGNIDKDISLERLILKDNNICYLCGDGCDSDDHVITNEGYFIVGKSYPSIEHVIPISKGGTHSWANVKLAHHYCNTIKSDKDICEASDQMILTV